MIVSPEHWLDATERATFERDGYLVVPDAIDAETSAALRALAELEDRAYRSVPGIGPHHVLNRHDLIGRDPRWMELCDWSSTFAKVWGILGWHIQLFHTQLIVTPPAPPGSTRGAYGWHQDNNRMNLDLDTSPQPRVSVKVGYFLTDVSEPGMGNLCVVPGSQQLSRPPVNTETTLDGAIEVMARAGDAIVFDRRLWHAASTNVSDQARVFLTYGYSYRWLRPKSEMELGPLLEWVDDPIRRQLLGASSSANGRFEPTDADVPLRAWIAEHAPDLLAP